jgi:hypothetical protein
LWSHNLPFFCPSPSTTCDVIIYYHSMYNFTYYIIRFLAIHHIHAQYWFGNQSWGIALGGVFFLANEDGEAFIAMNIYKRLSTHPTLKGLANHCVTSLDLARSLEAHTTTSICRKTTKP